MVRPITRLADPGIILVHVCNASSWSLEVDGPWGQVVPPRVFQWAFDISFELRTVTVVAAGVGIYLAGRILPLVYELRFCIRILSALFLHFVSYYCVYYMSCMYMGNSPGLKTNV